MPRTNIDYSKTVIYKIVCNDLDIKDCYVGHTTDFVRRKVAHKYNCNAENDKSYNFKLYKKIRENGGWNNFSIVLIEKYPCNDGDEARARERYWYENLNASLNTVYPARTKQEYFKEYDIIIKEYKKKYNELNKDKIKEDNRDYKINNKENIQKVKKNITKRIKKK